ncbi:hypothetical protein [Streptomyces sp. NPDC005970]|uniref:hypothetical protein n=1 Tax=Streptomyces sp. NPDC005970 TaxID=3156723 RepID=UPI0033DA84E6
MTASEYVPLATVAASFVTSVFALWTGHRTARMSWHTAYTSPRLDAVTTFLEAVDAFAKDPQGTAPATVRIPYQNVRLVFFSEDDPVTCAEAITNTCAALRAATRTDVPASFRTFELLEERADGDADDSDRDRDRTQHRQYRAVLEGIKEIQALQDEAHKAGAPAPHIADRVAELAKAAPPGVFSDVDTVRTAIGNAKARNEFNTRYDRAAEAYRVLLKQRQKFIDSVTTRLRNPSNATTHRRPLPHRTDHQDPPRSRAETETPIDPDHCRAPWTLTAVRARYGGDPSAPSGARKTTQTT